MKNCWILTKLISPQMQIRANIAKWLLLNLIGLPFVASTLKCNSPYIKEKEKDRWRCMSLFYWAKNALVSLIRTKLSLQRIRKLFILSQQETFLHLIKIKRSLHSISGKSFLAKIKKLLLFHFSQRLPCKMKEDDKSLLIPLHGETALELI